MNVKEYCKENKITQTELSKRIGCSISYISKVIHGQPVKADNIYIKRLEELGIDTGVVLLTPREKLIEENEKLRVYIKYQNDYIELLENIIESMEKAKEKILQRRSKNGTRKIN